jgi:taurine dioxygenase
MSDLAVGAITPFGVSIECDLSKDLDADSKAVITDLLWRRHLLVFPNQILDFAQQVEVMGLFGPVNREMGAINRHDYVTNDSQLGANLGSAGFAFHNDLADCPLPIIAISLFGFDVDPATTSTLFIDSTQVYRDLPEDLRDRLTGLRILHVYPSNDSAEAYPGESRALCRIRSTSPGAAPVDPRLPSTTHPLVMPHPQTGEPILFANQLTADRVPELSAEDSEALMQTLLELTYTPEHVYEHEWNIGDLVIWDNLAVQHGRHDQRNVERRTLRRVVCAEKSVYDQNPQLRYVDGHAVLVPEDV